MGAWIAWLAFSATALAAEPATYCAPLQAITQRAQHCYHNPAFASAAKKCVSKLQAEVALRTGSVQTGLAANGGKAESTQAAKLSHEIANLGLSSAQLESLLASAVSVQAELEKYEASMMWPGPLTPREAAGMAPAFRDFLAKFPCYKESHADIQSSVQWVEKKIGELKSANAALNKLHQKSAGSLGGMDSKALSPRQRVPSSYGLGSAEAGPKARQNTKRSDITGTQEDEAKRRKAP
jgi:hypothetical protein